MGNVHEFCSYIKKKKEKCGRSRKNQISNKKKIKIKIERVGGEKRKFKRR